MFWNRIPFEKTAEVPITCNVVHHSTCAARHEIPCQFFVLSGSRGRKRLQREESRWREARQRGDGEGQEPLAARAYTWIIAQLPARVASVAFYVPGLHRGRQKERLPICRAGSLRTGPDRTGPSPWPVHEIETSRRRSNLKHFPNLVNVSSLQNITCHKCSRVFYNFWWCCFVLDTCRSVACHFLILQLYLLTKVDVTVLETCCWH